MKSLHYYVCTSRHYREIHSNYLILQLSVCLLRNVSIIKNKFYLIDFVFMLQMHVESLSLYLPFMGFNRIGSA